MEFDLQYWHWLVLGMGLALVEIAVPTFAFLLFGMSAVVVGIVLYLVPELSLAIQVLIWAVSIAITTYLWFMIVKPRLRDNTMAGLSKESISNQIGIVLEAPANGQHGRLRFTVPVLGNDEWEIICQTSIEAGDRARVIDVSGNTLIVEKA